MINIAVKCVLALCLAVFTPVFWPGTLQAQSEEELLESIGAELEDEEAKKKELEEKEKEYDKIKAKADKALKKEDFEDAEKLYKQMGKIFPDKDYPNLQIRLVKQKREQKELAEKEEKFKAAMEEGNKLLEKEDFDKAKAEFQKAMKIFPDDREPKDKLKEVVKLKEAAEKRKQEALKQEKYDEFIAEADQALGNKDFETAKQKYKAAGNVKPDEKYPKDQLIETARQKQEEEERKKQELLDNKYNEIIERADEFLKNKEWDKAKDEYRKAEGVKPEESYPKEKIAEAEKLKKEAQEQAEKEALQQQYDAVIKVADQLLSDKKWDEAVAKYKEAAEIKSDESYPKEKIAEAEQSKQEAQKQAEQAAVQEQYDEVIQVADELLKAEKWDEAIAKYKEAGEIKRDEDYPGAQIEKAAAGKQAAQKAAKQAELDEEYNNHIKQADKLLENERYEEAIAEYKKAAEVKSDEKYPQVQIAKAEEAVAEAQRQAQREELIAEYELILEEAEQLQKEEKYDEALSRLEKAKSVWKDDDRADKKIAEVTKLRDEKQAAEQDAAEAQAAYDEAMSEAAAARENEEWDASIAALKKALKAMPGDRDAETKLAETEEAKKFAESAAKKEAERERQETAKRNKYDELIAKGDAALESENWTEAKANYRQASELFPEEEYPQKQMAEVDQRKEEKERAQREAAEAAEKEAEQLEEKYRVLLNQAEDAAELKEFDAAISYINQAKEIKPESEEPDRMLANIERMQAKAQSARKQEEELAAKRAEALQTYLDKVEEANSAVLADDFANAISLYKQAIDIQPEGEDDDLQAKIEEVRQKMEERKAQAERKEQEEQERLEALNEQYSELMGQGEAEVQKKNWTQAKSFFKQAQEVKPNAAGPRERIEDVERLIAKQESEKRKKEAAEQAAREKEEKYKELIARADEALENEDWSNSKSLYRQAADVKPEEDYPRVQAKKVDQIRSETEAAAAAAAVEDKLKNALMKGDQALSTQDFDAAISAFSEALEADENNKEAASKLEEAKEKKRKADEEAAQKREAEMAAAREEAKRLAEERREKKRKEREERIKRIEANKPEALANKYPEGSTKETIDQGYRVVEKTIVVEDGSGRKLIKLSYPWGQEFYYLNGKQISGGAYRHNLKKYQ